MDSAHRDSVKRKIAKILQQCYLLVFMKKYELEAAVIN